jgi:tyrosyl-tRNA synthetase
MTVENFRHFVTRSLSHSAISPIYASPMTTPIDFLHELKWRGLVHQCTNETDLAAHLAAGQRRAYVGFDPTADSLTIGNMVTMMLLIHFQRAGHTPVVVMGGGTGLIGDPSGKSAERMLMTEDRVRDNVDAQRPIFDRLWSNAGLTPPKILNNLDWLSRLSYIDALRHVGKHFSVNVMIQRDSVRERLHNREQGISYTEFSYLILQAYDFAHLARTQGVSLQMGGSDQWGNIVAGVDLIRRVAALDRTREIPLGQEILPGLIRPEQPVVDFDSAESETLAFGLTAPLVTKSDGGKFGKTESGAIWMTPERTSPYAMYQFWLNTTDSDVVRFLKIFTLLSQDEIAALEASLAADPGKREAHRALARHATALVHGEVERDHAEAAARALFSGDVEPLLANQKLFQAVVETLPSPSYVFVREYRERILSGEKIPVVDALAASGIVQSKREAREMLSSGSISINGNPAKLDDTVGKDLFLFERFLLIRRGKKNWGYVDLEAPDVGP